MRLLLVASPAEARTVRYLRALDGAGLDVHLFDPEQVAVLAQDLPPVTVHGLRLGPVPQGVRLVSSDGSSEPTLQDRVEHLARVIRDTAPDLVHTLGIETAGALVDELRRAQPSAAGVPWLATAVGDDLGALGRRELFLPRLRSVARSCDAFAAETHRDVARARSLGLRARCVGVWPADGGVDVDRARTLRTPGPTSARRTLVLDGVERDGPRAHAAAEALRACATLLRGWEVVSLSAAAAVASEVDRMAERYGFLHEQLRADGTAREASLRVHGRARVAFGLGEAEGPSGTFALALAGGAFPVRAIDAAGRELAADGRGALYVAADDPAATAAALRRALVDDALVDRAAASNEATAAAHLHVRLVRERAVDAYGRILYDHAELAS